MEEEKSCGTVVFHRNRETEFLLLHYAAGHWDFPKGHVEAGESEQETALREAAEETGLAGLEVLPGFREVISYFYRRGKQRVRKEVVFFLCESRIREVRISFEHKGYEWLPFGEAISRLTFENAKGVLQKAGDFLRGSKR